MPANPTQIGNDIPPGDGRDYPTARRVGLRRLRASVHRELGDADRRRNGLVPRVTDPRNTCERLEGAAGWRHRHSHDLLSLLTVGRQPAV